MHHDDDPTTTASLAAVAVHLQLGSTPPQVVAGGGRKADPRGLVVVRILVPAGDEQGGVRAVARLTITGTVGALRQLLTAMAVEVGRVDPDPGPEPPLVTRPHDTLGQ